MEKGKSESKKLPTGCQVIADLGSGVLLCKIDISLLREQTLNAQMMKPEMFRQLTENIKKRGDLVESLPFCVLTDKVEMVSGHHRLRAAKEAGLKEIYILLDVSGLSRSSIAAKQLAHNAINGFSDPSMLKEIAKMITDVDDMIESFIGKDVIGEPMAELEKLLSPMIDFDWKQIQFVFLPHQLNNLDAFVERVKGNFDFEGAGHVTQYEELMDCLQKYQIFKNTKNLGAVIDLMIQAANNEMDEAGFTLDDDEWVPLSRMFGSAAVPQETNEKLKQVMDKLKKEGLITERSKWKAIDVLIDNYL